MHYEPKVSVVVPVYNTEKYIHRCAKSLISQSYRNLEIIFVDDGSTDASGKICDIYAAEDARIKVLHQKNCGQGVARNTGINNATGDYIAFVDSDDYVAPYMYEMIMNIFLEKEVEIVCFDLHTGIEENFSFHQKDISVEIYDGIEFLRNLYNIKYFDSTVLKVFKKELFNNVRFPIGATLGEDVGCVYKLVYKAKKIAKSNAEIYYYYQSPNSETRGKFTINKMEEYKSFKERLLFFDSIGETQLYERALLQYEAVVLRSYYYAKKLYSGESIFLNLKLELFYVKEEIKKERNISQAIKLIYIIAASMPKISGAAVSRLM